MYQTKRNVVLQVRNRQDYWNREVDVGRDTRNTGKGSLYQLWDIVYKGDDSLKSKKKGDFVEEFGLHIGRPFYITTELKSHRRLDFVDGNRNAVIKTGVASREQQIWFFDWELRGIRNQYSSSLVLDAQCGGNNACFRDKRGKSGATWMQIFKYDKRTKAIIN
jgi:hypothetical protein